MRLPLAALLLTTAAAHAQLVAPRGAPPTATDKPATDKPAADKPAIDKPSTDKPGAADRPLMAPTREASVLYRVTSSENPPAEVRITTLPNGASMRIDMPDRTYMLVNQAEKRMALVVPDEQTVMDLPWSSGPQDQFTLNARMKFARRGADTVAATRCNVWEVALDGSRGVMCITDDGVLLRSLSQDESSRRSLIDALSVSYTPAPPKEFMVPPDFEHMAPPNGPAR